jgi:hypothetical protein
MIGPGEILGRAFLEMAPCHQDCVDQAAGEMPLMGGDDDRPAAAASCAIESRTSF